ncbi:MAG TPA: hypothetical protein PK760_15775, partial [Flavobacteriales bacterium]|nr:hypothetical protein [Flavobacteriales bacterium]
MSRTSRFEAGLQVGPSFSWLRGNKVIDRTDPLKGPAVGLNVHYNIWTIGGIRLGASYQQKGSSTDVTFTEVNGTAIGSGTVR